MILIASEEVDAMAHICTHKTRVRQSESNINFRRMKRSDGKLADFQLNLAFHKSPVQKKIP